MATTTTDTGAASATSDTSSFSSTSSDTTSSSSTSSIITSSSSISSTSSSSSSSSSSSVGPSSTSVVTSTLSVSSVPPTTQVLTSVITQPPTASNTNPVTVVITTERPATSVPIVTSSTTTFSSTSSSSSALPNEGGSSAGRTSSHGLGTAGVTAIAVVVPVVVVALLVIAGILLWRKRKQKKATEEERRKEVEDYGFNPNNDPTLPTVVSENGGEMTEDHTSGYRGWGAATASSRKMSTTLSGGHTHGQLSESSGGAAGGMYYNQHANGSPNPPVSDDHSDNTLIGGHAQHNRDTMDSDEIGNLGAGPVAGANNSNGNNNNGMRRGVSNASSRYSHGGRSDTSDGPPMPSSLPPQFDFGTQIPNPQGYGYSQHGPYGDGTYGGGQDSGMPVVRDVSARRNTRIQQPGNYQQGNSGIAQNF